MKPFITRDHLNKLLAFQGYGNPAGRYWFMGMEEGGTESTEDLVRRATQYREVEDLERVHQIFGLSLTERPLNPAWATMSRIVLRLSGDPDWKNTEKARAYQATRLGRFDRDTFLTEVSPLPAPSTGVWPYAAYWPTRDQFFSTMLPRRFAMLRELLELHQPSCVFCYGRSYWMLHRTGLFPDVRFSEVCAGKLLLGHARESTIVLTPFFAYYQMTNELIDAMAKALEANGLPNGVASPTEGQ